jgi:hypothetical protein
VKINQAVNYQPAKNFRELIALVRAAEERLIEKGYDDAGDRVHIIRGIYYGTVWSADHEVEKSPVRNVGFQTFTASSVPDDPRPFLKNNLFEALRQSRDVQEGSRHVDFSHLMIGMDARRSYIARTAKIPSQGGTGLELSTWLGDIGGGAGMLAKDRVSAPNSPALTRFRGLNFGGSNNLEGDIAGYVIARDKNRSDSPGELDIPEDKLIADVLEEYLSPGSPRDEWRNRCTLFLRMIGGRLNGAAKLENRKGLIDKVAVQVAEFGCVYLFNRLRQNNKLGARLFEDSLLHLVGAANEVAQVFVDALIYSHEHQGARLEAHPPAPPVTPKANSVIVGKSVLDVLKSKEGLEKGALDLQKKFEREARDWEKGMKKYLDW